MSELLPGLQAMRLRDGLLDYLTTTFALADADARAALHDFLADEDDGMFKGPYLRTGMPFSPAPRRAEEPLDWMPAGFGPYAHQAAAFRRLTTKDGHQPEPTLVTTGTGSGKTEAFLLPILDHCLRARGQGIQGIKAILLYPMNALANDQAQRIAEHITAADATGHRPLGAITAALYTGELKKPQTLVTPADGDQPASLITDRSIIRDDPPDILLTNYKMLDQLLLREADQKLWSASAHSLTYLVLDEFHTYDGAQGTDVAMLLRRLGLALKAHNPNLGDGPLGRITPIGTSATLASEDDGEASIVEFASRVFGLPEDPSWVVREQRLTTEDWADAGPRMGEPIAVSEELAASIVEQIGPDTEPEELARIVLHSLWESPSTDDLKLLAKGHPFVQQFLGATRQATHLTELAGLIPGVGFDTLETRRAFLLALHGALGHLRAKGENGGPDRKMPSTEVHLWVREVTRLDRFAQSAARFRWSDDGPFIVEDETLASQAAFPSIYCRECGRSGWGVGLAAVGLNLDSEDRDIRRNHLTKEGRFRPLLHLPGDGGADPEAGILWFDPRQRELLTTVEGRNDDIREGRLLRVQTHIGSDDDERSKQDECPSCHQKDTIRFMGSAIATLMSVSLSTMFGEQMLDELEKKALVFTDSVQDAAHRAGFVTSRSHALTLRSVLGAAVSEPLTLDELVEDALRDAGDDPFRRYRLLAPELAARDDMPAFWNLRGNFSDRERRAAERKARRRLLFDATLEFGLTNTYGRTLERTGTLSAHVEAGSRTALISAARDAMRSMDEALFTHDISDAHLVAWVRGTLERIRTQGGVSHEWLHDYIAADGARWKIWGGRRRYEGMPAFPTGRAAPAFPRVGGSKIDADKALLDPVSSPQAWYAWWARRTLNVDGAAGGVLARQLLDELAKRGWLVTFTTQSNATVYAVRSDSIIVSPTADEDLAAGRHVLDCDVCQSEFPVSIESGEQLDGAPCLHAMCPGHLSGLPVDAMNYYRRLYRSTEVRRVVAREHTGMLTAEERLSYENGFKASGDDPTAPNVLVATPTLEMGIDIGDLSAVFLASLPRNVANYVQRVGRAGRLTGNALDIAFVEGRGQYLPRLGDPSSLINGVVTPPATYLSAEEILRRQYIAHIADELARDPEAIHPRTTAQALKLPGAGPTYLGQLVDRAETDADERLERFLTAFEISGDLALTLRDDAVEALRDWALLNPDGGSGLRATVGGALQRWHDEQRDLKERLKTVAARIPDLEARAQDSDDDERALKEAISEQKLITGQIGAADLSYWIGTLEMLGLLPNYSLVDDSVQLDVTMSWMDPDTREWQTANADYRRASANALRDFAPGATFYVAGHRIGIDSVEIGHHGSELRTVRLCPECGYVAEGESAVKSCPRCEQPDIADVGQRFASIELTKVSAYVRRDEARIDDSNDTRAQAGFTVVAAADINPERIRRRWYTDTGVGVAYLRQMDLRWFNLGPRSHTTAARRVAGDQVHGPLFKICAGCGHLDKAGNRNTRDEHRPWCQYRNDPEEHTADVLLHRHLVTEGVMITLPPQLAFGADPFVLPSLRAAVMLGLRQSYGGSPDHLAAERITDPGSNLRPALLLHDLVPGGTGYLAELAEPDKLWAVLANAYHPLAECACAQEERLACHRCLLPFAAPHEVDKVSRSSALKYLTAMLGLDDSEPEAPTWQVTDNPPPPSDAEWLEERFQAAFNKMAERVGASLSHTPGSFGVTVTAKLGSRTFKLRPQVPMKTTTPDFVLSSDGLPDIAIYVDGWQYHASPLNNRIADDAYKRRALRNLGHHVLSVTAHDINAYEKGERIPEPWWFDKNIASKANALPALQHNAAAREALLGGPFDLLAAWMLNPDEKNLRHFGRTQALMLFSQGHEAPDGGVERQAVERLGAGRGVSRVVSRGPLAIATRSGEAGASPFVAVLDDTGALGSDAARQTWRQWLQLANITMFVEPQLIDFYAYSEAMALATPAIVDLEFADLSPEWSLIAGEFEDEPEALRLVAALAAENIEAPDGEVGYELGDGVPFDLVWTQQRIAVSVDPTPAAQRYEGWTILPPDSALIAAAWRKRNG